MTGGLQVLTDTDRHCQDDRWQRLVCCMTEGDGGCRKKAHTINAQFHQPAISVFNLQVLHCMLLLPDNPAFIVELGNRSALLHALLNRVVAALA